MELCSGYTPPDERWMAPGTITPLHGVRAALPFAKHLQAEMGAATAGSEGGVPWRLQSRALWPRLANGRLLLPTADLRCAGHPHTSRASPAMTLGFVVTCAVVFIVLMLIGGLAVGIVCPGVQALGGNLFAT